MEAFLKFPLFVKVIPKLDKIESLINAMEKP